MKPARFLLAALIPGWLLLVLWGVFWPVPVWADPVTGRSATATGFPALRGRAGLTPAETQIAAILDAACPESMGKLHEVCEDLIGLPEGVEQRALGEMAPDEVVGESAVPLRIGTGTWGAATLFNRLRSPRQSHRPANAVGFAPLVGERGGGGGAGDSGSFSFEPFRDAPFGLFIQGRFQSGRRVGSGNSPGLDFENRGFTLGMDYPVLDELTAGLSLSYQNLDTAYQARQGGIATESWKGAFYGSYFLPRDVYLAWVVDYTSYDYALTRRISLPLLEDRIRGNPNGRQYGLSLNLGQDWQFDAWEGMPYARLEYANLRIDPYRERDTHGLALAFAAQSDESLTTAAGLQISRVFSLPCGVLRPSLRFEWEHQYQNDDRAIKARFLALPGDLGGFTLRTGNPDRDYFNLGGALTLALPGGNAAFLQYETRLGQQGVSTHDVELGVRFVF